MRKALLLAPLALLLGACNGPLEVNDPVFEPNAVIESCRHPDVLQDGVCYRRSGPKEPWHL